MSFIPLSAHLHIVIDLETLDTSPTSLVLSIGAASGYQQPLLTPIQWNLELSSQMLKGRTSSVATRDWWTKQPAEVQEAATCNPRQTRAALEEFCAWFTALSSQQGDTPVSIWGNSPSFDLTILANLLTQYGFPVPWKYFQEKDLRTFGACMGESFRESREAAANTLAHSAKADAVAELAFILRHLREERTR